MSTAHELVESSSSSDSDTKPKDDGHHVQFVYGDGVPESGTLFRAAMNDSRGNGRVRRQSTAHVIGDASPRTPSGRIRSQKRSPSVFVPRTSYLSSAMSNADRMSRSGPRQVDHPPASSRSPLSATTKLQPKHLNAAPGSPAHVRERAFSNRGHHTPTILYRHSSNRALIASVGHRSQSHLPTDTHLTSAHPIRKGSIRPNADAVEHLWRQRPRNKQDFLDALDRLRSPLQRAKTLLSQLQGMHSAGSETGGLVDQICSLLAIHSREGSNAVDLNSQLAKNTNLKKQLGNEFAEWLLVETNPRVRKQQEKKGKRRRKSRRRKSMRNRKGTAADTSDSGSARLSLPKQGQRSSGTEDSLLDPRSSVSEMRSMSATVGLARVIAQQGRDEEAGSRRHSAGRVMSHNTAGFDEETEEDPVAVGAGRLHPPSASLKPGPANSLLSTLFRRKSNPVSSPRSSLGSEADPKDGGSGASPSTQQRDVSPVTASSSKSPEPDTQSTSKAPFYMPPCGEQRRAARPFGSVFTVKVLGGVLPEVSEFEGLPASAVHKKSNTADKAVHEDNGQDGDEHKGDGRANLPVAAYEMLGEHSELFSAAGPSLASRWSSRAALRSMARRRSMRREGGDDADSFVGSPAPLLVDMGGVMGGQNGDGSQSRLVDAVSPGPRDSISSLISSGTHDSVNDTMSLLTSALRDRLRRSESPEDSHVLRPVLDGGGPDGDGELDADSLPPTAEDGDQPDGEAKSSDLPSSVADVVFDPTNGLFAIDLGGLLSNATAKGDRVGDEEGASASRDDLSRRKTCSSLNSARPVHYPTLYMYDDVSSYLSLLNENTYGNWVWPHIGLSGTLPDNLRVFRLPAMMSDAEEKNASGEANSEPKGGKVSIEGWNDGAADYAAFHRQISKEHGDNCTAPEDYHDGLSMASLQRLVPYHPYSSEDVCLFVEFPHHYGFCEDRDVVNARIVIDDPRHIAPQASLRGNDVVSNDVAVAGQMPAVDLHESNEAEWEAFMRPRRVLQLAAQRRLLDVFMRQRARLDEKEEDEEDEEEQPQSRELSKSWHFRTRSQSHRSLRATDRYAKYYTSEAFRKEDGALFPPILFRCINRVSWLLGMLAQVESWQFDVFAVDRLAYSWPLTFVFFTILRRFRLIETLNLDPQVVMNFIRSVECGYLPNPYHNSMHGADVVHGCFHMLVRTGIHSHLTPVELLALIMSAAIHDFGHPGVNNNFLINSGADLALRYNDSNVLESYHSAGVFDLMRRKENDILQGLSNEDYKTCRSLICHLVLSTDLSKHFTITNRFSALLQSDSGLDLKSSDDRRMLMTMIIKCADIAHPARPSWLHLRWTERVTEEFFRQGDMEKQLGLPRSQFMDRSCTNVVKSQTGFIGFLAMPIFTSVADALEQWFDCSSEHARFYLRHVEENLRMWREQDTPESESKNTSEDGKSASDEDGSSS